jgi:hypothetical protein
LGSDAWCGNEPATGMSNEQLLASWNDTDAGRDH